MYNELTGNLITLALEGKFDVIGHGVNCYCTMGAGIAPQMAKAFGADKFIMEVKFHEGDINKLGTIDYEQRIIHEGKSFFPRSHLPGTSLIVVNAYTQFDLGRNHKDSKLAPVDYEAITLCMRKINYMFAGLHIGLPQIGAGLGGGDWEIIKCIIQKELTDCDVTIVIFDNIVSKFSFLDYINLYYSNLHYGIS